MICIKCGSRHSFCVGNQERCWECGEPNGEKLVTYLDTSNIKYLDTSEIESEWLVEDTLFFGYNYKELQCIW
jgi:hypothetical protein